MSGPSPIEQHRAVFRAIAATVIPEAAALDAADWQHVETTAARALAQRSAKMQRQFALLLRIIEHGPRLSRGRRFTQLDAAGRTRVLEQLQRSPVKLLRRGVWGVRTLALLGFYTMPAAIRQVGYRAHPRGWQMRTVLP